MLQLGPALKDSLQSIIAALYLRQCEHINWIGHLWIPGERYKAGTTALEHISKKKTNLGKHGLYS